MPEFMLLTAVMIFVVRLSAVRRRWSLPMKDGEERFLGQPVGRGFYSEAGGMLLRRYRVSLLIPLLVDAPLSIWLALTERYDLLLAEQFISMLAAAVLYNVIIAHYSYRAQALSDLAFEPQPTTLQLSMEPRRLRDHTNLRVELGILAALLLALLLLARKAAHSTADYGEGAEEVVRRGIVVTTWIIYLQAGLVLLKVVFVRWRMPLPARRTEEFRKWRSAWLTYHLKVFDSVRILFA